jgi:uroporphyrin-III C-methyltransferase/precorrin-2 dehydrogenase/sirohydrochlorin ferrochelatase
VTTVTFGYPISLELEGRRVVVIGAGAVRAGKVEGLLAAGATDVLVVAAEPAGPLEDLSLIDGVTVRRGRWRPEDLEGALLCIAAHEEAAERDAIARAARARNVLVNVMDDVANCDWSAPAIVRRGELVLAIATGGASPALARRLRERLAAEFGEEWAEIVGICREVRAETIPLLPDLAARARRWRDALDLDEAVALVRAGRSDELRGRLRERLLADAVQEQAPGRVFLVGAGPGDPRLITVRGADALRAADVVVYDRLVSPALLDLAPAHAERIYAGKEPGRPALRQPEIDALLVERAGRGDTVVRLKGGDPFVFGRGGEEALACARAGVPCEVVPGVTSALAAPAAAGIPVTHRGLAHGFTVVTASGAHGDRVDLAAAARGVDTLVILMAAGRLAQTCATLVAAGRPSREPAAIVQWATTADQRAVVGTLGDLPALAVAASIGPPATLVVGAVAELARELAPALTRESRGQPVGHSSSSRP